MDFSRAIAVTVLVCNESVSRNPLDLLQRVDIASTVQDADQFDSGLDLPVVDHILPDRKLPTSGQQSVAGFPEFRLVGIRLTFFHDPGNQFTGGWSGAEVEQCVVSAITKARLADRDVSNQDLITTAVSIVSLARTMKEQITQIRAWAFERAVRASTPANRASKPMM